ncbi:pseudouridine synthase [Poseidonocella sp. HB161398]|uniref:pseudouridine synthase n=1 Tax=Poseidonocella sp. HB161398 TaxID=2320855 RepID=UPI0011096F4D|nr:pseudouridine synthase [Poseidonocella sp. HB161398]
MTETPPSRPGERIAKILARSGVASRREAETIIAEGRVRVNGKIITSPALNVTETDRIDVDGVPLKEAEPPRLWLYHKPAGLVTTAKDEKGRETVFDTLPEDMPRVMSVGRLDLNSEGLLLLTNDGAIKRKLELPSTGWLRKYRVRVKGAPEEATLEPLRKGVTVEGERFQPMEISLDRQQGSNAWLTVGLREGRNREIRRAMESVGLTVNRLIRVSYGPFRLNELAPGAVEEVKTRVVREQLGLAGEEATEEKPRLKPQRTRRPGRGPGGAAPGQDSDTRPYRGETGGKPVRGEGPARRFGGKPARGEGPARSFGGKPARGEGPGRSSGGKPARGEGSGSSFGSKPARGEGSGSSFGSKPARGEGPARSFGGKPARGEGSGSSFGSKPARGEGPARSFGGKPARGEGPARSFGGKPARGDGPGRSFGGKPARGDGPGRSSGGKPAGGKPPRGGKPGPRKG